MPRQERETEREKEKKRNPETKTKFERTKQKAKNKTKLRIIENEGKACKGGRGRNEEAPSETLLDLDRTPMQPQRQWPSLLADLVIDPCQPTDSKGCLLVCFVSV